MTRVAAVACLLLVVTAGDCFRSTPLRPTEELSWTEVAAGGNHSCGVASDGNAYCWGLAVTGQLGTGAATPRRVGVTPRRVDSQLGFRSVSAGLRHSCALTEGGRLLCWGSDGSGQLGVDTEDAGGVCTSSSCVSPTPVAGSDTLSLAAVTAGGRHTCALTGDGDALCWGDGSYGQLGLGGSGPDADRASPTRVDAPVAFSALSAGRRHTCGLDASGSVWCWGDNGGGQVGPLTGERCAVAPDTAGGGDPGPPCASGPVRVPSERSFTAVAAGGAHTCALDGSGAAWCWGSDARDALGQGQGWPETCTPSPGASDLPCSRRPVRIASDRDFASVTAGGDHACARTADGSAWCWGDNGLGQTGYCGVGAAQAPQRVCRVEDLRAVSAGGIHTCGVTGAGEAWCWGANGEGQLGSGSTRFSYFGPVRVGGALSED